MDQDRNGAASAGWLRIHYKFRRKRLLEFETSAEMGVVTLAY